MREEISNRGAEIINEMLCFSMGVLKASSAALTWIEWTDGKPVSDDSPATAGLIPSYLIHYRESAAAIDPLNLSILASNGQWMRSLAGCRVDPPDGMNLVKYESFLRLHGFGDEIDLVMRAGDSPVATLGLLKKRGTSFESVDVQWPAVHRFLQHHLSFHPRIVRKREASELQRRGGLTARELEVALLLRSGASNAAIADQLRIGLGTARTHVVNVLSKLGIQRRAQVGAMLSRWSA